MGEWGPIVTGLLALMAAIISAVNRRALHHIHLDLNSKLTMLLEATSAAKLNEGRLLERGEQEAKAAAAAAPAPGSPPE